MEKRKHFEKNRGNHCIKSSEKSGKIKLRINDLTMWKSLLILTRACYVKRPDIICSRKS